MRILSIKADNFRNFSNLSLEFNPHLNLFFGENGSGKTSLLEVLYFLSYGKSFRTHLSKRLIQEGYDKFTLFSKIISQYDSQLSVGIEKSSKNEGEFRLTGEKVLLTQITTLLPIQVLNNDSFLLLTDGPLARRQFLDWGVFHVKHSFISVWRDYQRAIKQRNNAIRLQCSLNEIQNWDAILHNSAEILNTSRQDYIALFIEIFVPILKSIIEIDQLSIRFYQGWPINTSLGEILKQNNQKDLELGYTYYGAHRADLKITVKGKPIEDVLSRGQLKIFAWLMRLSQSLLLNQVSEKKPIILIDDLGAELDKLRIFALSRVLKQINGQLFITAIDKADLDCFIVDSKSYDMFHVEHDSVRLFNRM